MNLKKIAFLCFLIGAFCACNQSRETNTTVTPAEVTVTPVLTSEATVTGLPENTKTPSVTGKPENSPTEVPTESLRLTPTPEPADELIPIDTEHFTDVAFRKFISVKYDTDGNGYLSRTEREIVEEMDLSFWHLYDIDIELDVVDGLEYFPKLKQLVLNGLYKVIIKNHPSLEQLGGTEIGIAEIKIEDCPALESIVFSYSDIKNITIKNCENLKFLYTVRSISDDVSGIWEFRNTPELIICTDDSFSAKQLILDADAVIAKDEYYTSMDKENMISIAESGITLCDVCEVRMEGEKEDSFIHAKFSLADSFTEADFAYMGVQVLEKMEDSYDEQGRKGWNICIDRKIDAYSKTAFSVYTEERPEPEQIHVCPGEASKVDILEYSPNRGIAFKVIWDLEVVYRNEAEEAVLGTMTESQYWTIGTDGVKRRYTSENEWKKNASYVYQVYEALGWK